MATERGFVDVEEPDEQDDDSLPTGHTNSEIDNNQSHHESLADLINAFMAQDVHSD